MGSSSTPFGRVAKKASVLRRKKSKKFETSNSNSQSGPGLVPSIHAENNAISPGDHINSTDKNIEVPVYLEEPKASKFKRSDDLLFW